MKNVRGTLILTLVCGSMSACLVESSKAAPYEARCNDYCSYRESKGCGGIVSSCSVACQAGYVATEAAGSCKAQALAKEECFDSHEAVDLGCTASYEETAALCRDRLDAYEGCVKERDGKK